MGARWGSMGGPMGASRPFIVACCAVNIPIYWQYLEGFEPTTQYQFLESFKTILWEVLNTYAVSVTRPALFCGVLAHWRSRLQSVYFSTVYLRCGLKCGREWRRVSLHAMDMRPWEE